MYLLRFSCVWLLLVAGPIALASDRDRREFEQHIQPILNRCCVKCHNHDEASGDLDLTADQSVASVIKNFRHWMVVLERLEAGDMPPEDVTPALEATDRELVIAWIRRVRNAEAERTSGDPGMVLARRLSNAEYNYTIRDLTGVDIRPAQAFPVDPANEAGFDNSGESLAMSPALVTKYLAAARTVSEHLALTPTGFTFAPHPVITDTDRDKFCVNRIIDFYRRQRTDYVDYFLLLWQHQVSSAGDRVDSELSDMAKAAGLSGKYAVNLWSLIVKGRESVGPIAALQSMWQTLPSSPDQRSEARAGCEQMARFVTDLRESLVPDVPNLTAPQMNNGSQALVLWKNRQFVAGRRKYSGQPWQKDYRLPSQSDASEAMASDDTTEMRSALERFCNVFPDKFFVSERARVYLDPKKEQKLTGRYLSAGFHSQMGYFRDDGPLYDLMLDPAQQQEIDRLWLELDFITSAPMRQYAGFIWFDRTDSGFMRDREFDRYRAEDKECTSEEKVRGLEAAYIGKAKRLGASDAALEALRVYFDDMSTTFRRLEKLHSDSEEVQVAALVDFTERAFRRPLTDRQRRDVFSFYRLLREEEGLSHEDAIREGVTAALMSPYFCYRVDLPNGLANRRAFPDAEIVPLDAYALASRLSYFLWSSMPDDELLRLASDDELSRPDVLKAQVHRMLRDDRARGLAVEFAGNWLDFRRFTQHNGVDRGRFPSFTDQLRQSMYEEPIRFLENIISNDRSVLDCLYGDYTFVNPTLAKHYGVPVPWDAGTLSAREDMWWRVDDAGRFGRGGVLPMAVFLTYNSPGLRTSPVKRGNWLVKRVLGENVPVPPAAVPELPEDETQLGELTLRDALERHRADKGCAVCHERIDAFGLAFEGYGPIGERRARDLGGRTIDDLATFPDESEGRGLEGLKQYIQAQREQDFLENLCRKLLAYGLGRTLQLSDERAVSRMRATLHSDGYQFSAMVEVIVTDPAFLNKRLDLNVD